MKKLKQLSSWAAKKLSTLVIECNDTQSHNHGVITMMRLRNKSAMTEQVNNHSTVKQFAFTLAEVLITLAIIGVVAALTIPNLMHNYQQKVQKEQVRMVKYKLTQATSLMNTYGLIGPYATTKDFVDELQKYMKLTKVCENDNLEACWPTSTITVPTQEGTFTTTNVKDIKTGTDLKSLGLGTKNTQTMGIVFADGTPMILTYSPYCTPLDMHRNYEYSFQDNKPVTNATTNCISAIFDINGAKEPNRIGTDVRALNSLFGYKRLEAYAAKDNECTQLKKQSLVKNCLYEYNNGEYKNQDYYAGAVKKCNDMNMHLPDIYTLANIAGAYYGRTDIGAFTIIYSNYYKNADWGSRAIEGNLVYYDADEIPSVDSLDHPHPELASGITIYGDFWSGSEVSAIEAYIRNIYFVDSIWNRSNRYKSGYETLCVGD